MTPSERQESISRLGRCYDPEAFRKNGEDLLSQLQQYLKRCQTAGTLDWTAPEKLIAQADGFLDKPGSVSALSQSVLASTHRLHSFGYMGHQVPPAIPLAGLFDSIGKIANQGCALYEMGPFPTAVEMALVRRLAKKLGWSEGFGGFGTHGGTLANLTALLAARNIRFPQVWEKGVRALEESPAILVSGDSHYSLSRAAGVLGVGTEQVIPLELNSRRQVTAAALKKGFLGAKSRGLTPFAVVANSGSTPVGAFDLLGEISEEAKALGLWLHVDGAHGASVSFSKHHSHLLKGIENADSVTWDAHKLLWMPALATFLLFRSERASYESFRQDAPYLFDPGADDMARYDGGTRTLECTKSSLALGLWGVWGHYGEAVFSDAIDLSFDLCRQFHGMLRDAPDFEPCHEPQANILCFRYLPKEGPKDAKTRSDFQQRIRRQLVEGGKYYVTATRLGEERVLRVTLMNALGTTEHLSGLMDEIRRLGRNLLESGNC